MLKDSYNDLVNHFEIKGNSCNLEAIMMTAFQRAYVNNDIKILELNRLALKLNQYEVFEENVNNVSYYLFYQ